MAVTTCPYCEKDKKYPLIRIEKSYAKDENIITEYACSLGHTFKTKCPSRSHDANYNNYCKSWYSLFV